MLDTASLFSLSTLKPVYPVLGTAFLQLNTDDLSTLGYFHACNPPLSVPLGKGFCCSIIPLHYTIFARAKNILFCIKNSAH